MATKQTSTLDSTRSLNKLIMPFALASTAAIGSIVLGRTLEDHVDRTSPKPAVSSEPTAEVVAKEGGSAVVGSLSSNMLAPRADSNLDHKFGQLGENNSVAVELDHSRGTPVGQSGSHPPTTKL